MSEYIKFELTDYFRAALIILFAAVVGGGIAVLGNQLGRYIGRKKMSIFKLRPRHTSMLFTVLTGMAIAGVTLILAMILSEPVRITFLNPKKYVQLVNNLETQIEKLNKLQQTDLLYKKQDIIVSAIIKANPDSKKMSMALKEIVSKANQSALAKSESIAKERNETFVPPPDGRIVGYIPDNLELIAREMGRLKGEYVIFARAFQHATVGNRFPIEIGSPLPNDLVFKKGETVYRATIDGTKDYFDIYDQLLKAIKENISLEAMSKGLFPNPEDRSVGEFDDAALKNFAKEIKKLNQKTTVEFYAKSDTHILGPLKLDFVIK